MKLSMPIRPPAQTRVSPVKVLSSPNTRWLLWSCALLNIGLLSEQLNPGMLIGILLILALRAYQLMHLRFQLARWVVQLVAMFGCVLLFSQSGQLGVLLTMLHLLCFSYALKQLELTAKRDVLLLILLGKFLLASALIFYQSVAFFALVCVLLLFNLVSLLQVQQQSAPFVQQLRLSARMLLASMPLAIALFFLLPKLTPFWQVPLAKSAKTGLAEQVTPGDVANLALSNALAFRVKFFTPPPPLNQRYWRTLVLETYDGRSWTRANASNVRRLPQQNFVPLVTGASMSYQMLVQPSQQAWLYALPVALVAPQQTKLDIVTLSDYTLQTTTPLSQVSSYYLISYPETALDKQISAVDIARNLALPAQSNPRLVALANKLRMQYRDDRALIHAVLTDIGQQNYRYTLRPPLLNNNSLDQFYFDTKAGFCVHYAASFAVLMRAAGIPTRLITGYLGGEYNGNGDYFSVYQYDAHAWTEVWLDGVGWQRVDPTAAVSPERVEFGFAQVLMAEQAGLTGDFFNLQRFQQLPWLNALRQGLAAVDFQWTRWIVSYSSEKQSQLLSSLLGNVTAWKMALLMFAIMVCSLAWLFWLGHNKTQKNIRPKWQVQYQLICQQLAKRGLSKSTATTALQFSQQVQQYYPTLAQDFRHFTQLVIQLNYYPLSAEQKQQQSNALTRQYQMLTRKINRLV
jgi:protein-glutamine gamma-glutamyltransferase